MLRPKPTKYFNFFKNVFIFTCFLSCTLLIVFVLPKKVSAAAFNVTVEDNIAETLRWTSDDSGCSGERGITLTCLSNCSDDSFRWDCNDGLGGHLNIWGADEGSEIQVQLVEPLPTAPSSVQFTDCTWTFFEFLEDDNDPDYPTRQHGSGSDCSAEFVIPENSGDFQYGVMFIMQAPPTPTPTPGSSPSPGR